MRSAGARLLAQAQAAGLARNDIDGTDLFAFVGALAWLADQPALAPRTDRLAGIIVEAILMRDLRNPGVMPSEPSSPVDG